MLVALCLLSIFLRGSRSRCCAVDTTIEVAKVPFKVAGAAVDLAVPDDDDDDD